MNKAMAMYDDVIKEIKNKFGDQHKVTIGVSLHFVNVQKFDYAMNHIQFIKNVLTNHNYSMCFEEKKLFQDVLTGFIDKLLYLDKNHEHVFNNELKENCLKIFEYQLFNVDDINIDINNL